MTTEPETPGLTVQYGLESPDLPPESDFRAWAAAALAGRRPDAELCVRLVDEAEGRSLNHAYRGRDKATNVLSFPAELPEGVDSPLLGDLAICVPVVLDEAARQGKQVRAHFAHLTVHGVLHLLGHDHQNDSEAEAMEAAETAVMARLGFPDPYRDSTISPGQHGGGTYTPS